MTVFTNGGGYVASGSFGGDRTNLAPKITLFNFNDKYAAQQYLCKESISLSVEEGAGVEPDPLLTPEIDPIPPLVGQQAIHLENMPRGALTTVSENSVGEIAKFATVVTW